MLQALGKLNPQSAFMKGKLKIKGNIMLTQKLKTVISSESKLWSIKCKLGVSVEYTGIKLWGAIHQHCGGSDSLEKHCQHLLNIWEEI